MNAKLLFVHALSPLHAGTGQGSGVIDLPIAREKATGIPYVPGSSIKGVLREQCANVAERQAVFGPETIAASEYAGSLQIADARLLLLPVRSLRGTFAWVTCPYVLRRFARDAQDAGQTGLPVIPMVTDDGVCLVAGAALKVQIKGADRVVLEDLDFTARTDEHVTTWATKIGAWAFGDESEWQTMLQQRMALVSDDVFTFLLKTSLEVVARIRMEKETKTVADGALWYEEALPAESILASIAVTTPVAKTGWDATRIFTTVTGLTSKALQIGGKATVGRGLCRMRLN